MLNEGQVQEYGREGFLSGIPLMRHDQIQYYRDCFDALEAREGRDKSQVELVDRHFEEPFIWEIATHSGLLDCVEAIIGPNILMLSTHFFCKYGQQEKFVAWHQDLRYWGIDPPVEVAAWYAVDDSDRENGCMRVIPRLHRDNLLLHGKSEQQGNLLSINQEIDISPSEEEKAVDCTLKAGEMSLHDGLLVHGSPPNRSDRRRCGLTVRFIPTQVKPMASGPEGTGRRWRPILVRGTDSEQNFQLQSPPFPLEASDD